MRKQTVVLLIVLAVVVTIFAMEVIGQENNIRKNFNFFDILRFFYIHLLISFARLKKMELVEKQMLSFVPLRFSDISKMAGGFFI